MSAETIFYIIVAGVISFALALFMYGYKAKHSKKLKWIFGTLRFLTIFSILVLLINPKFKTNTYTIVKPKLPVLIDNSASISELNQDQLSSQFIENIKSNNELNSKFDISYFSFGTNLSELDSLSFSEKNSNISKAISTIDELYKNEIAPYVLVSDGNQTLGKDYEFSTLGIKNPIYPLILGDSTSFIDVKIQQLNTNRYAFLKNQFPVEAILAYNGQDNISTTFVIKQGNTVLHRENVSFSKVNNTKTFNINLTASRTGLQKYTAQILPIEGEKNTTNNSNYFAVEVIDQATNILIVSNISHPDIGMLIKSIETNEQRKVSVAKPSEALNLINDTHLVVLYQPDQSFSALYNEINSHKINTLLVSGLQTDWNFVSTVQTSFRKEVTTQSEEVLGYLNKNYGTFLIEDIGFERFPPLKTKFGGLEILSPHETVLEQYVDGFSSETALLATSEVNGKRDAILDGEGIWRWRAQSYLRENSFEKFDDFIGRMIQYLASSKRKSRLDVNSEAFYYNNLPVLVTAQFFDKNYVFDSRASLVIKTTNKESNLINEFPLLVKNNYYKVDLNSLPAGEYLYTIQVKNEPLSRSGSFSILDFNVEKQFLNADVTKLTSIATNSDGKAYFASENQQLISDLINDEKFQQIQKSEQKVVPLIDWKYLLALIVILLSTEWFIRKYNGLI